MTAWQQGPSGSQVVKQGRESPTAAATAIAEVLALGAKALKQSLEENVQIKATIETLQREVEDLQRSLSELKHEEEDSRQSVLLGQLVNVLEDIVRIQVMGPKFPPTSLAGIQDLVADGFVSEEGRRKWNKFVTRLEEQGLSVRQVMTASTPLRRQRFAVAHGTMEERVMVSTAQLREWASGRDLQPMVETILKVLQPLTCEGQPLLPRSDINDMFA